MTSLLQLRNLMLTGAARVPHTVDRLFNRNDDGSIGAACAIGAILIGNPKLTPVLNFDDVMANYEKRPQALKTTMVKHPLNGQPRNLEDTIVDLNDAHRWSIAQIAEWLKCATVIDNDHTQSDCGCEE